MNYTSISDLKKNPSLVLRDAATYPVAVEKRNKTQAYIVGKELFEKIVDYIENYIDNEAVKDTDFSKGKPFEKVVEELGL